MFCFAAKNQKVIIIKLYLNYIHDFFAIIKK